MCVSKWGIDLTDYVCYACHECMYGYEYMLRVMLDMNTCMVMHAETLCSLFHQESQHTCSASKDYIAAQSRIYGRNSKGTLTKYQESMNNVAMELCMQNPNLLSDRKALLELSRKKLDETGNMYKKGKSRAK